jgi:hypothetical protein
VRTVLTELLALGVEGDPLISRTLDGDFPLLVALALVHVVLICTLGAVGGSLPRVLPTVHAVGECAPQAEVGWHMGLQQVIVVSVVALRTLQTGKGFSGNTLRTRIGTVSLYPLGVLLLHVVPFLLGGGGNAKDALTFKHIEVEATLAFGTETSLLAHGDALGAVGLGAVETEGQRVGDKGVLTIGTDDGDAQHGDDVR